MSFPHLTRSGSKITGSAAELSCLAVQYVLSVLRFDSSVCLLCCGVFQQATTQEGVLKTRAWGWHSSRGCYPSFSLLAPLSWEPFGEAEGSGWGTVVLWRAQHASAHERPWLTIPFEATGCKGEGHWQVTTKMGLFGRKIPQAGVHWTGSYTYIKLIFIHSFALFNQQPFAESRFGQQGQKNHF